MLEPKNQLCEADARAGMPRRCGCVKQMQMLEPGCQAADDQFPQGLVSLESKIKSKIRNRNSHKGLEKNNK
jgi:hypothetical protein